MSDRQRVLFVCTHNSARSQMAEAALRHIAGDRFEAHSAGTEATVVRPEATQVMAEIGIDIAEQRSKTLRGYVNEAWDFVITVCDDANESCPVFPGTRRRLHWSLPDPSRATGSSEQRLESFRSVRDEILTRVQQLAEAPSAAGVSGSTA